MEMVLSICKEHRPLIDVLIPVFNANDKLRTTLESIFSHSVKGTLNVVVVDNCTEGWDVSLEQDFPEATFHHNRENLGRLGNWDECLKHVSSDFYMFLMAGDKLTGVPRLFRRGLESGCAYVFDMKFAQDGNVREMNKWRNNDDRDYAPNDFLRTYLLAAQNPWGPLQTWIFPRSTISRFQKNSQSHADILYILEAIRKVQAVKFVKFPIVEWTMCKTRFHSQIDLLASRKADFVIIKHYLEELGIAFSEPVLFLRFFFWSGVVWLRNPTFNLWILANFLIFRRAEQRLLRKEILDQHSRTLRPMEK